MKSKKQIFIGFILMNILIFLDQITKKLAVIFLKDQPAIPIMKDVFELRYLENTSAAFGLDPVSILHHIFQFEVFNQNPQMYLDVRMGFFYIVTVAMICVFIVAYLKIPNNKRFIYLDWILLFFASGAIGNLIDRMSQQYVIDFLYFKLIDFPIFNVADIYVTCAAFVFLGLGLFYYKDEDFEMFFPSKKEKVNSIK